MRKAGKSVDLGQFPRSLTFEWAPGPQVPDDSFGNLRWQNTLEGVGNRYLFQGREWDSNRQDYYFRNRIYVPEWGSFTGPDMNLANGIEGEPNGLGSYLFCDNNPLGNRDPLGLYHRETNPGLWDESTDFGITVADSWAQIIPTMAINIVDVFAWGVENSIVAPGRKGIAALHAFDENTGIIDQAVNLEMSLGQNWSVPITRGAAGFLSLVGDYTRAAGAVQRNSLFAEKFVAWLRVNRPRGSTAGPIQISPSSRLAAETTVKMTAGIEEAQGVVRFGGYDPVTKTVHLGDVGHFGGMKAAGGTPLPGTTPGLSMLETPKEIIWANDSLSLPRALTADEAASIQKALQAQFQAKTVRQVTELK